MVSSQDVEVTCKRCSNKTLVRDMKYDLNGKDLICGRCYELKVATSNRPKMAGHFVEPEKIDMNFVNSEDAKKIIKYYCTKCKFKFQRKLANGIPKTCPYCNKPTVVKQFIGSADSLINESLDRKYEF